MTSSCWPTWICSLFIKFLTDQLPGSCDLILPTVNASGFGPVSTSVFYFTCQFFFSLSNATGWLCFIETPQEYSFCKSNAMQRRAKAIQIFPAVTNEVLTESMSFKRSPYSFAFRWVQHTQCNWPDDALDSLIRGLLFFPEYNTISLVHQEEPFRQRASL